MDTLRAIVIVALALSCANWLLFVVVFVMDRIAFFRLASARAGKGLGAAGEGTMLSPRTQADALEEATGTLATSFRRAGSEATAAAMSLACLLIAVIAAGITRL